jgi:hypothetical protein
MEIGLDVSSEIAIGVRQTRNKKGIKKMKFAVENFVQINKSFIVRD